MTPAIPLLAATTLCSLFISSAFAQPTPLPLIDYLEQVRASNPGLRGSFESAAAGFIRQEESGTLTSPTLLANAQLASDQKPSSNPMLTYDKVVANTYSLGLGWQTRFGLQAKISYNINYSSFTNLTMSSGTGSSTLPAFSYFETKPSIELIQPLLSNGFGRSTRATQQLLESQALASAYGNRFQAKALLSEAEATYWRLALARQALAVQRDALDRAQKIHEWSKRRVRLHLADEADALQANALVEVRKLEFENATQEQRDAARAFNSARNIDGEEVTETLAEITPGAIETLAIPPRETHRDDVLAAEQAQKITIANAVTAEERNKPSLDLFGSYALNGKKTELSESLGDPFSIKRPTQAIGLRLSMPLDFVTQTETRRAWSREQAAAEKILQKKLFDESVNWKALNDKFSEAKRRFNLVRNLEKAQLDKLEHEKDRLQRGRTVTYQVLLFEQDYLLSQLSRLRSQTEILMLIAQLKLFGGAQ